jgi:hypothetical protein
MKRNIIGMPAALVVLSLVFVRIDRAAAAAPDDASADVDRLVVITGEQSEVQNETAMRFDNMTEQISRIAPDNVKSELLRLVGAGNRKKAVDETMAVRKKFYMQNFTPDEIRQLVDLYESPVAKKLTRVRAAESAAALARFKRATLNRSPIHGDSETLDRVRNEVWRRLRPAAKKNHR